MLQKPFNDITYDLIGDDAAPSFFRIDQSSGKVLVSNNLANDGTRNYKVSSFVSFV